MDLSAIVTALSGLESQPSPVDTGVGFLLKNDTIAALSQLHWVCRFCWGLRGVRGAQ